MKKHKIASISPFKQALIAVVLALTLSGATISQTSCYGSFAVTGKIYNWNGGIGNKFLRTLVFWGLIIIPVYEIVMLGDGIIFNVIEFWSGSNPVASAPAPRAYADGSIEFQRGDKTYRIRPLGDRRFDLSVGGERVATGKLTDEGLIFSDERAKRTYFFDRDTLEQLKERLATSTRRRAS